VRIFLCKNISLKERKKIENRLKLQKKKKHWKDVEEKRKEITQTKEP